MRIILFMLSFIAINANAQQVINLTKMIDTCKAAGLPEPIFDELDGGIQVTLQKDIYTEDYLNGLHLNERQVQAVLYAKPEKIITNIMYQELFDVSKITATTDLSNLVVRNILRATGKALELSNLSLLLDCIINASFASLSKCLLRRTTNFINTICKLTTTQTAFLSEQSQQQFH